MSSGLALGNKKGKARQSSALYPQIYCNKGIIISMKKSVSTATIIVLILSILIICAITWFALTTLVVW